MFLKRLDLDLAADREVALQVYLKTPAYELQSFGRLPNAETALRQLSVFPDGCAPEDCLLFAAFDHETPVALAQLARHLPQPDTAVILLLLVAQQHQRGHVGCEVVGRLSRLARQWPGIERWQVSVLDSNEAGLRFWHHCGFEASAADLAVNGFQAQIHNLRRPLKRRPACQHGRVAHRDIDRARGQNLLARIH